MYGIDFLLKAHWLAMVSRNKLYLAPSGIDDV